MKRIWMVAGAIALVPGIGLFVFARFRLAATILCAVGVLGLAGGWLMLDGTSKVDTLRTAGHAAGSIVALYALWLNDRRRLLEEGRHELERQRADVVYRRDCVRSAPNC
jgi:peptidoglycan/LPS O-acetylase OafA/YrhL